MTRSMVEAVLRLAPFAAEHLALAGGEGGEEIVECPVAAIDPVELLVLAQQQAVCAERPPGFFVEEVEVGGGGLRFCGDLDDRLARALRIDGGVRACRQQAAAGDRGERHGAEQSWDSSARRRGAGRRPRHGRTRTRRASGPSGRAGLRRRACRSGRAPACGAASSRSRARRSRRLRRLRESPSRERGRSVRLAGWRWRSRRRGRSSPMPRRWRATSSIRSAESSANLAPRSWPQADYIGVLSRLCEGRD